MFKMMKMLSNLTTPSDELWLCHRATGTVIGGENLGWILSPETVLMRWALAGFRVSAIAIT